MSAQNPNQPLVSIVTPVYNAERFILETIKTVQNQTYQNWELILVDDKSSDNSVELIKQEQKNDPRIILLLQTTNQGAAKSRNIGTNTAKGRYLAFLDADDLWTSDKLIKQINFIASNNYSFIFSSYQFADPSGVPTAGPIKVPAHLNYRQSLKNHIIWTSTVMADLEQLPRDLLLMPDIRRGQDTATWWQILRNIDRAHSIEEPLAYYRRTTESLSANKLKAIRRTWYLLRKVENLNTLRSAYNFCWYGFNAVIKRVI